MAEAFWLADIQTDSELSAFLHWRCSVVTSLVAEIRAAVRKDAVVAVIPSVARPTAGAWYEGTDLAALAMPASRSRRASTSRARSVSCATHGICNGGSAARAPCAASCARRYPDMRSSLDVVAAVAALKEAGIADIAFYNYGHLRQANLDWIGAALTAPGIEEEKR